MRSLKVRGQLRLPFAHQHQLALYRLAAVLNQLKLPGRHEILPSETVGQEPKQFAFVADIQIVQLVAPR